MGSEGSLCYECADGYYLDVLEGECYYGTVPVTDEIGMFM